MIKGSMMYDQHGRKRKVKKLYTSKKATPNFAKQEAKQFKEASSIPSMPVGEYKVPVDNSYKKEVSKHIRYHCLQQRCISSDTTERGKRHWQINIINITL